ncbi:glycosyltransferase family 4 protein [Geotalea uraniireducens]|uniref:Glycosyl transferase, group 1 n=1 Tax=Geotalea uraniireducens (strain Rf4) TaxID=351605 RepID=A5GEM3_GEOUR|nr:glycosyltransferase family 1 protein [Geotalea uraniireducens]ABQ25878.1 glycosyl transferase, group 1 [Geotalea uraniireducens Rf4]
MLNSNNSNLTLFVYGGNGGSGGLVSYCKGLFGSRSVPLDIDVFFICSPEFCNELGPLDSNVRIIQHSWISNSNRLKRLIWHLWIYPRLILKEHVDVELYVSGSLPLYRRIFHGGAIIATTCHNLLPFDLKEIERHPLNPDYRAFLRIRKELKRSLQQLAGIIFISEHSKNVVLEQLITNPEYAVIPHGLEEKFRLERPRSYVIGEPVTLLYVSPVFPYKHHDSVVRSVKWVRDMTGRDIQLRLVGGGGHSAVRELEALIKSEHAESYVTLVGNLGRKELSHELTSTDIFVFASSCEAFPITLLEAMGFRLPIACSNRVGMDTMLRDAGVYFDPEDVSSLSQAIIKLLSSEEMRRDCGEKAFTYAQEYTWVNCAIETFRFLSTLSR